MKPVVFASLTKLNSGKILASISSISILLHRIVGGKKNLPFIEVKSKRPLEELKFCR